MINAIKELLQVVNGLDPVLKYGFWIFVIGVSIGILYIIFAVAELIESFAESLRKKGDE